ASSSQSSLTWTPDSPVLAHPALKRRAKFSRRSRGDRRTRFSLCNLLLVENHHDPHHPPDEQRDLRVAEVVVDEGACEEAGERARDSEREAVRARVVRLAPHPLRAPSQTPEDVHQPEPEEERR